MKNGISKLSPARAGVDILLTIQLIPNRVSKTLGDLHSEEACEGLFCLYGEGAEL